MLIKVFTLEIFTVDDAIFSKTMKKGILLLFMYITTFSRSMSMSKLINLIDGPWHEIISIMMQASWILNWTR